MKRLLSLLTVMLMLVTVFAFTVTANADNTYLSASTDKATYSVGDTAYVEIKTTYAEGIGSLGIDYSAFDTTVLSFNEGKSSWGDNGLLATFRDPFGKNVSAWAAMGLVDFSAKDYVVTYAFDITALPAGGSTEITFDFDAYGSNNKVAVFSEVVKVTLTVECTNHNFINTATEDYLVSGATCQSPAIYKKSCEHCGVASATETFENGSKLDHTYTGGWVTDGDDTHTRKCDNFAVCGHSETLAHNWNNGAETEAPSCFEEGTKTYTCTDNCGGTKEEDIDPTGNHIYGDWVKVDDNTHSHTCTTPGCGASEPGNHTWDNGSVKSEPSCYELGVKEYTCTDDCGATKEEDYGTLKDHTYGDWAPNGDGTHSRTCQVTGCGHVDGPVDCTYGAIAKHDKDNHKKTCSVCGDIEYIAHVWGEGSETKAPSCAEGEMTYTCACTETKTEAIPATGEHDYTGAEWVTDGETKHIMECNNCEEFKEEAHTLTNPVDNGDDHVGTCSVCGETDAHEAHDWDDGVETDAPSCFEKGTKTYTCDICHGTKEEDIDPTGAHVWGTWTNNEADGNHVRTCTTPGCSASEPAAHNWDNGSVTDEPSCFENGTKTYTCTDNCGATKDEDIDPTGAHVWGAWVNNEADGNHVRTCTTPGCTASEPAAHNWDNGTITDEPSCFENGTKTYTCTDNCGATKEEDVDPTGAHVWGDWADNGDNHVRYCQTSGCTESNYADHAWSNNCDTLCDTCGNVRTVVHIYGHVSTADEHWNACGVCGDIEPGSRAPHNIVNGECTVCGYQNSRPMSGFFYVNDDYHMMVLTDGVITGHHTLDVNGDCTICGAHISDVVEDEIVIEAPVESDTEETETEPVVNPTTGLTFALITVAAAAAVAVASKKH